MTDIMQEIKELKAQAQESKIWQNRYEELKASIEETYKSLSNIINIKASKVSKVKKLNSKLMSLVDKLYIKLKSTDGLQYGSNDIEKILRENNLPIHNGNISNIRNYLSSKDGIKTRKDGKCIFVFYEKFTDDIKIGKVSYMG